MLPRHHPGGQLSARITPLECAVEHPMKDLNVHVSLLECAVTKKVGGGAPLIREHPRKSADKHVVLQEKEFWLGGLDSNQDSQIQSLESYQLDDLPSVGF